MRCILYKILLATLLVGANVNAQSFLRGVHESDDDRRLKPEQRKKGNPKAPKTAPKKAKKEGKKGKEPKQSDVGPFLSPCPIDTDGKVTICHTGGGMTQSLRVSVTQAGSYFNESKLDYCGNCTLVETDLRNLFLNRSNARVLLEALDNRVFPQSMLDSITNESLCGFVSGETTITSELYVPTGSALLTITGEFTPTDGTPLEDIVITLYGVDSARASSDLHPDSVSPPRGLFDIVLSDPLPGIIPYFLVPRLKNCTSLPRSRQLQQAFLSNSLSMIYINNPNEIDASRITVTLTWDEQYSDVDLHTVEPGGKHVFYGPKIGDTGYLDRDDIDGWGPEHYYSNRSAIGNYTFYVNMFSHNNVTSPAPPVTWTLEARRGTTVVWTKTGTFADPGFANTDDDNFSVMFGPYEVDTSIPIVAPVFNRWIFFMLAEAEYKNIGEAPLAASDWFYAKGKEEPDRESINWLYQWQRQRENADLEREKVYEDAWNNWINGRFVDLLDESREDYVPDTDLTEITTACNQPGSSNLQKAICAGEMVVSVFKRINEERQNAIDEYYLGMNFFSTLFSTNPEEESERRVCRHHAVFHAACLYQLGIRDWKFYRGSLSNDGHLYLGVLIDETIYVMDAYNNIYVQYDIDTDKFTFQGATRLGNREVKFDFTRQIDFDLTPAQPWKAGGLWSNNPISIEKNFYLRFQANFGPNDNGGDGLVFVLQPTGTNIPSPVFPTDKMKMGHFLAYDHVQGLQKSIGVEFDTYYWASPPNENRNDIPADHIAIVQNADILNPLQPNKTPVPALNTQGNIEDGQWHNIRIQYDLLGGAGATISVFFDDDINPRTSYSWDLNQIPSVEQDMGLQTLTKVAYWGFTSATGDAFNKQSVRLVENVQYGIPGDNEYSRYKFDSADLTEFIIIRH